MRRRVRGLVVSLARAGLRVTLRVLTHVVPATRQVVVSAFPETEGNGVETARALVRRYEGRVVWLTDGHEPDAEIRALEHEGLVLLRKVSARGVWAYLRAETIFFTHGLYGSPVPRRGRPVVNLWHGDGPKDVRPDSAPGSLIHSTYLVGSTTLFTGYQGRAFGMGPARLLLTGNPRTDQLWRPVPDEALADLGITGDFVVWMPTFRTTRPLGATGDWAENAGPADGPTQELSRLREGLAARGVQLVVKPHPMDADRRRSDGDLTLTERDLVRAGVTLYGLLGRSAGLITDYSSVWVDYLLLDRPMAFLVSDRDTYSRQLLPPDVLDWLPGEVVDAARAPFAEFLDDLDEHGLRGAVRRKEVAVRIGLQPSRKAADDLLTALRHRGALRCRDDSPE